MSSASTTNCQILPSEYAYHPNTLYHSEHTSANCRNYSPGEAESGIHPEHYIHCDGTQLKLADSDFGSDQYTASDYYQWNAGTRSQLLFILPTRVNLTNITLHYYSGSGRGLPRLRFYAVPDDFDIWDASSNSYRYKEVAAMTANGKPTGIIKINFGVDFKTTTMKVLLYKFTSSYSFALSEVEFFNDSCSVPQNITPTAEDSKVTSNQLITTMHKTGDTSIKIISGTSGGFKFIVRQILHKNILYEYNIACLCLPQIPFHLLL